jgi:Fe-S-cluster-containing dehydrogenase component
MKRLLIDLDICSNCEECGMLCSYIQHPANNGITHLREFAHFALQCRRCEDSPCVAACPWQALEFQDYNALKRYTMRCTSCKSCSNGCPFGTIYPETIPFIAAGCDLCIDRLPPGGQPICIESCGHGGLKYGDFVETPPPDPAAKGKTETIYKISDHLLAKTSFKWERDGEALPIKKRKAPAR